MPTAWHNSRHEVSELWNRDQRRSRICEPWRQGLKPEEEGGGACQCLEAMGEGEGSKEAMNAVLLIQVVGALAVALVLLVLGVLLVPDALLTLANPYWTRITSAGVAIVAVAGIYALRRPL
jgi:hypothetical protein